MTGTLATGPPLHDSLPGVLFLGAVIVMAALTGFVRLRGWGRRTLARHHSAPSAVVPIPGPTWKDPPNEHPR